MVLHKNSFTPNEWDALQRSGPLQHVNKQIFGQLISASWKPKGEKQHGWSSSSSATTGPGGWWMSHCDATKRCHCKLGQHPPPPTLNIDVVHYELPQVARVGTRRPHGQRFNGPFEAWIVKSGILTQCVVEGDASPHNNSDRQNAHYCTFHSPDIF